MAQRAAEAALDLLRMPRMAALMRSKALPDDMLCLLEIAAGGTEACRAVAERTGETAQSVVAAANFFIEEILLFPGADAHRCLGVAPGADKSEMRRHLRLLMRWLQPERNTSESADALTRRLIAAWKEASGAPPAAGHRDFARSGAARTNGRTRRARMPWIAIPLDAPRHRGARRRVWRTTPAILAACVAFAALFIPDSVFRYWLSLWR